MMMYNLFADGFYLVVWGIVLAGSVILLRRGYASAAVSMLLGAAVVLLMGLLNLLMAIPVALRWPGGIGPAKMMMMAGLISTVGMFLFALGFLQLARMTKREG
jgi:hypothetical protein